jgi:hypothetical protein
VTDCPAKTPRLIKPQRNCASKLHLGIGGFTGHAIF